MENRDVVVETITSNSRSLIPPLKVLLVSILICMGSMSMGIVYTFPSPAFVKIQTQPNSFRFTGDEQSWAVGAANIGGFVGGMSGRFFVDNFGRKTALFILLAPLTFGWLLMSLCQWAWMMILGRALTGIGVGIAWICSPVFVAEIAPTSNRGLLLMLHSFLLSFGTFWTFIIGKYLSWRWMAVTNLGLNVIMIIGVIFIYESPRWLLLKGYSQAAIDSLQWYRQKTNVVNELKKIQENLMEVSQQKFNFRMMMQPDVYYPLLLTLGLVTIQIWGGINAINAYMVQMFQATGAKIDPFNATIITSAVRVFGNFAIVLFMDKAKRRHLLIISGVGMVIGLGGLAAFFYILATDSNYAYQHLSWVPITSFIVYMLTFNIGWSQLPTAMIGELLPLRIRGFAGGITVAWAWICIIVSVQTYPVIVKTFDPMAPFILYAGVSLIGVLFAVFCLPETKDKTLEEIEKSFRARLPLKEATEIIPLQTISPSLKDEKTMMYGTPKMLLKGKLSKDICE